VLDHEAERAVDRLQVRYRASVRGSLDHVVPVVRASTILLCDGFVDAVVEFGHRSIRPC
jgi:hypothetical protein